MKYFFGVFLIFTFIISFSQEIENLYPTKVVDLNLNFTKEYLEKYNSEESMQACSEIWNLWQEEGRGWENATIAEKEILKYCNETKESPWSIIDGGCSWYCSGGPQNVTASSELNSQGKNTYSAKSANDLNYKTGWVEGVKGYGIGEYLLYTFAAPSPRVNKIIVVNGYVKSQTAWKNNSRVKRLKVYKDNKPIAILNLQDKRSSQFFDIELLGYHDREDYKILESKPDWTLKFEILEVYKGDKYDDVVISEIYFDGIDVHCLAKGTLVTMGNNSKKPIEQLSIGDTVLSFNQDGLPLKTKIKQLASPIHTDLIEITFNNGKSITCTNDHPFLGLNDQWFSFNPSKTATDYDFNSVSLLKTGTHIKTNTKGGNVEIISIDIQKQTQQTYTIVELEKSNIFIANDILVGTEKLKNVANTLYNVMPTAVVND